MLYPITIEKVEGGYRITPTGKVVATLNEAHIWVRGNFQVDPDDEHVADDGQGKNGLMQHYVAIRPLYRPT